MSIRSFRQVEVATLTTEVAQRTAEASTLPELIQTIPRAYQAALGELLTKKFRLAHKHANVQSTITMYERHDTEGSFPPIIRNSLKEPRLQFAKEFLSTTDGSESPDIFRRAVIQARKNTLSAAILEKRKELAHLSTLIGSDEPTWTKVCENVAKSVVDTHGGRVRKDATGTVVFEGMPPTALTEFTTVNSACATYSYRCIALARVAIDRAEIQKLSKLKLKDSTDVEMTDAAREPAVRDIIREELKALKKELNSSKTGQSPLAKRQAASQLTPRRSIKKARQSGTEEILREEIWEESEDWWQEEAGKEVSVDVFLASCSKDFRPWLADEYPSMYLELSDSCRNKIAFSFLREWEADSIRTARPGVFKHADVQLPADIEYSLAVNHKFILHPKPQVHDVDNAKDKFVRTVRIRWQFRNTASKEDYIPKFHVQNPFWEPQLASPAIEFGLEEATKVIDAQVGQALSSIALMTPRHGNMNWTRAREFLIDNQLLVKLTDKNLGVAVFPANWYHTEVMKMLQDGDTYVRVSNLDTNKILQSLDRLLDKWELPRNMDKFIRHKTQSSIPNFHAIPKVHKTPWTLRPIVPSHSWVTSRVSEVVDHLCRPILAKLPWVVNSTKQVINNFRKIKTDSDEEIWICTGDVAAFYTNIDSKQSAKVTRGAFQLYCPESKIDGTVIAQMIRFIMENNYFEFSGEHWKQEGGLAMGTSCAPVLANIYAGFYERKLRVTRQSGVLLYNRYIDDILCIFQGTRKELIDYLQTIELGPLTINWSYSRTKKEFLDIEIMRIRDTNGFHLDTRLFKKAMNKHLYIPWSSAHPSHVKKGFVKAELIRFAMVSSKVEYFAEARAQFYGNLRRRGYPPQTLEDWFKQVSYGKRSIYLETEKIQPDETPLMLPGQYNPVWEYINVEEVLRTARRGWSLERELPESLKQPLIRSLGRSTSLGDLLSAWNKTILHPEMLRPENSENLTLL